jgi:hypothetical protein
MCRRFVGNGVVQVQAFVGTAVTLWGWASWTPPERGPGVLGAISTARATWRGLDRQDVASTARAWPWHAGCARHPGRGPGVLGAKGKPLGVNLVAVHDRQSQLAAQRLVNRS